MVRAIAGEIGAVGPLTNAPSAGHELPKWAWLIYLVSMSTVSEIETALQTLPIEDARKVADWLQQYLDEKWDRQIEDIAAGRLHKLADKALQDYQAGRVKPLDEIVDQS
jgi:hypothetical protein